VRPGPLGPFGDRPCVSRGIEPLQADALKVERARQVRCRSAQNDTLGVLGVSGGVFEGEDGAEAVADKDDLLDTPGVAQLVEVIDHKIERIDIIPGPFGPAAAALVQVDHAQVALQLGTGEPGECLAALSGAPMKEHHRHAVGSSSDPVPEAHIVDDGMVLARGEVGRVGDLGCGGCHE
jgi:hypothetical protein